MGVIYLGSGWSRTPVGEYENGIIYACTGWNKTQIGAYDGNTLYRATSGWSRTPVGVYEDGIIYSGTGWNKTQVGAYDSGTIYAATSGWSRTEIGSYDFGPAGAAALLLFPELQRDERLAETVDPDCDRSTTGNSSRQDKDASPLPPFLPIIFSVAGVVLFAVLVYHMYFTVKWKWASYAMFFTSLLSFIATCFIMRKTFTKNSSATESRQDLISNGLTCFVTIGVVISFIIYIIEQVVTESLTFGMFLLGIVIAPVNYIVYAFPFAVLLLIILFITKAIIKR